MTFPSLYVFAALQRLPLDLRNLLRLLLVAILVHLTILASLAPVFAFFAASTKSYATAPHGQQPLLRQQGPWRPEIRRFLHCATRATPWHRANGKPPIARRTPRSPLARLLHPPARHLPSNRRHPSA